MKAIPNWPHYFADESGIIYRQIGNKFRQLEAHKHKNLRRVVHLTKNRKKFHVPIARLMLETFISSRPKNRHACHGANGCFDDSLPNLAWRTREENMFDKIRDGTRGGIHVGHKLNELQVRIILRYCRLDRFNGVQTRCALLFDVGKEAIYKIVHHKTWRAVSQGHLQYG